MADINPDAVIHEEVEELIEWAEDQSYSIWSESGIDEWEFWIEPAPGTDVNIVEVEEAVREFVADQDLLTCERLVEGPMIVHISEIDVENEG